MTGQTARAGMVQGLEELSMKLSFFEYKRMNLYVLIKIVFLFLVVNIRFLFCRLKLFDIIL